MKFSLSRVGYFADFATMPLALTAIAAAELTLRGSSWEFVAAAPAGFLAWTLFEYGLHRLVFHSDGAIGAGHDAHHRRPASLIGVASWYTFLIFGAVYAGAVALTGFSLGGGLTFGFAAGYLAYITIHYAFHHLTIGPHSPLYAAKMRHVRHHHGAHGNYGVIVPWWDAVFRTLAQPEKEQ